MFILVLFSAMLVSTVISAPTDKDREATVLSYHNSIEEDGSYYFSYETSNGIFRSEDGKFVDDGKLGKHLVVDGFYSYTDPDGEFQSVKYKVDENGYQVLPPEKSVIFTLPSAAVASLLG